jgi:hypothetical protein
MLLTVGSRTETTSGAEIHRRGLYDWSQRLQAFRKLASGPERISISRRDADDLQTFVYAVVDYIYDSTHQYRVFAE